MQAFKKENNLLIPKILEINRLLYNVLFLYHLLCESTISTKLLFMLNSDEIFH